MTEIATNHDGTQPAAPAVLYKAVRPDGTSFYDHHTRWDVGTTVEHPDPVIGAPDAEHYLSVSSRPADCTGMHWPGRLLIVAPIGECWQPNPVGMPSKWAATAYRVVDEEPSYSALGPQGREVAAIIDTAEHLTGEQIGALAAAWAAAWDAARDAAWAAARDAAWDAARAAAWDAARAAAWDAAWDVAWAAAWDAARVAGDAACAARDAAVAYLVRDLISDAEFHALVYPWLSVVGEPVVRL